MIRLHWRSKFTEYEGHGEWFPDAKREFLQAWIDKEKAGNSKVSHWIESKSDDRESMVRLRK